MKEQLATRLEAPLRRRLRVYAAVSGRTVAEVVSTALDGYLPPLAEMVRAAESGAAPREVSGHGRPDTVLAAGAQVAS